MFPCDRCNAEGYESSFKTERGLALHKSKAHGLKAKNRAVEDVASVRNFTDVVKFAIYRLGCDFPTGEDWKKNVIILSYSGYKAEELAETIEWCANTGRRFQQPWKVIVHVDAYHEEKSATLFVGAVDPIQAKLDALYALADGETRKRIRAASNKTDKREALALIRELA